MSGPHRARAEALFEQRRHDLAEPELRAALAAEPDDAELHMLLALSLAELERDREALEEAERSIALAPELATAHFARGYALTNLGRWREARDALGEAIRLDPRNPSFFGTLARAWIGEGRWRDALAAAEDGLAIDPEHGPSLNMRAIALRQLGRGAEATATIQAALARDPQSSAAHANRGWSELHAGAARPALEAFAEALRLNPTNDWAREGIVEALKARNPLYALMLRYFLWISRLSPRIRLLLVIGAPFAYRALRDIAGSEGETPEWFNALAAAYIIFLLLTWLAVPIFNLLLRLDPLGRHALSDEDRLEASLVGAALAFAIVSAAIGSLTSSEIGLFGAVGGVILALPLSSIFDTAEGWPRTAMMSLCVAVAALVGGSIVLELTAAPSEEFGPGWFAFGVAIAVAIVSTWVAAWLRSTRPA